VDFVNRFIEGPPQAPLTQIKNPHKRRSERVGLTPSASGFCSNPFDPGGTTPWGYRRQQIRRTKHPSPHRHHPTPPHFY